MSVFPLPIHEIYKIHQEDDGKKSDLRQVTAYSSYDDAIGFLRYTEPGKLSSYILFNAATGTWKIATVAVAESLMRPLIESRAELDYGG